MKGELRLFRKMAIILAFVTVLIVAMILAMNTRAAFASSADEKDYTFETVPVESIEISVDGGLFEIQPRQEFSVSFEVYPWYTTTSQVYFDILPAQSAIVTEVSKVKLVNGKAQGSARITVAADAEVGSTFEVLAGVDNVESNVIEMTVAKVPVTEISLSWKGSDDKLHIGKTRTVECEFFPTYASFQDVRYELSGSGLKYIQDFDATTGTITARSDVAVVDANAHVTITAYSVDNPNAFDSVTLTLYMPTTVVELSAETPLGRFNDEGNALAVASSLSGDTVKLNATVNGVDSTGLNYVIVKGQEYVENGYIHSDGTFVLRPTSNWSESMKIPHPEVKIMAAYSDGFDEITVSLYIPVERLSFINPVVDLVENFRTYDLSVEAFPKYATLLADNTAPIYYSLNGIDGSIATVDASGVVSLPKSLTSKGSIINYSASLVNAWTGVDIQPLTYDLTVIPVYAESFKNIEITKNGAKVDGDDVKALPSDNLQVDIVYNVDNVTDIDITLIEDSGILLTSNNLITVFELSAMQEDNPFIEITVNYNHGGNVFSGKCYLSIYIPALSAEIADAVFNRDETLNLNSLITINGHGYATNKTIEWGEPTIVSGDSGLAVLCDNGLLDISTQANAGTSVRIPYRTFDSETWQYKEFAVAPLAGTFSLEYGQISSSKDNRKYDVDIAAPQLEEGQSVEMHLKYNGMGGKANYGLTYSIEVSSDKATLVYKSGDKNEDVFTLGAKSGQSGQSNYITYKITIYDGDATYYVCTYGVTVPSSVTNGLICERVSIFKRISGTLGVSNSSVEVGSNFSLTGWDTTFTFNKDSLVWSLSGGTMSGSIIKSTPNNGFILTITANQMYNNQEIIYSSQITFSSVIYKYENSGQEIVIAKRVYKRQGSSLTLDGEICFKSYHKQTGWSTENGGAKLYSFGQTFSANYDLTLFAYWVAYRTVLSIEQEIVVDENQNCDSYTDYMYNNLSMQELKQLGYTKISVTFAYDLKEVKRDGPYAKIWLEIDGEVVFEKDRFSLTTTQTTYYSYFTLDITKLSNNSKIRVGVFAHGDWEIGKYTFAFYKTNITLLAT